METEGLRFKKLRFRIKRERSALLVSIGVALLLWVFLKLSKTYQSEKTVGIQYHLPPLMQFTSPPPNTIVAIVTGTGIDLMKSYLFQPKALIWLDLAQLTTPEEQRSELMSRIQAETGLTVEGLNRNYLVFSIDSTITKKVPVVPDLKLTYQRDFFPNRPLTVTPESLLLSGPVLELAAIDSVFTQFMAIENIGDQVSQSIPIKRDGFRNVVPYPGAVTVEISAEQFTEKTLEVPIVPINAPVGSEIIPGTAQISCSVALARYEELVPDSFRVEVDLGTATVQPGGSQSVPVYVRRSPDWVKSPLVSPKVVRLVIVER